MEQRELGRTGLRVSVLGFGGSEIGFEAADPSRVRRLLQEALDAGLNVIDTAECYGDSESLIGHAIADRRPGFHLFTKCGHFEGTGRDDWSPASLEKSIARSLARLRTDHVDLLQLHTCSEDDLRRGEVIEVIERARQRGQTRFIGYSGDGPAARYAVECGRFDTLQTSINVADQEALRLTLPLAHGPRRGRDRQAPDRQRGLAHRASARPTPTTTPTGIASSVSTTSSCAGPCRNPSVPRCASPRRSPASPRSSWERRNRAAGARTPRCSRPARCPPPTWTPSATAGTRSPTRRGWVNADPLARVESCRGRRLRSWIRVPPSVLLVRRDRRP